MKNLLIVFISVLSTQVSLGQKLHFVYYDSIPVSIGGNKLLYPWMGGLQAPEFDNLDIDQDGDQDLFVFDRYDKSIHIFENEGGTLHYSPLYQNAFPEINGWVVLEDFNCDGKQDIFTSKSNGVAVYKNISTGNIPAFEVTTSFLSSTDGPILIPFSDMPGITDVDFDGDIDILTFDAAGSYVIFYKNLQVENSLSCNDLVFTKETICWGDFKEGGLDNTITLGDNCGGGISPDEPDLNYSVGSESTVHVGSSIMAFDYDGDRDMDVLIGDISANNLVYMRNGKDSTDAIMDQLIDSFPTSNPVNIYIFANGYHVDVDFDGDRDIVASPGSAAENSSNNYQQTWLYENTGSDQAPSFSFVQKNFLLSQSIELGSGAAPAFVDYDLDGDMDIVVGNFLYKSDATTSENALALFENTGTTETPSFKLINTDFAGTSSLGLFNTYPAFGDLDGDGDQDMLLGEFNGKFQYFKNTALAGQPMNLVLDSADFGGLDVGSHSTPCLYDIDADGDLDIISGERNGNINFFENTGDSLNPVFSLVNDSVGFIRITSIINAGHTTPRIADITNDGKPDLITGTYGGDVFVYSDIRNNMENKIEPLNENFYNPLTNEFSNIKLGKRSAPAIYDLNNDSLIDIMVGLFRGGMVFLKNESDSTLSVAEKKWRNINIYPNPAKTKIYFQNLPKEKETEVYLYDALGQMVVRGQGTKELLIGDLKRGIYFVLVKSKDKIVLKDKVIKL